LAAYALVFVDFLDELGSGVMPVSAAEIRDEWTLAYAGTGAMLLVVPMVLAMVIETPLLLLSDRWPRTKVVPISLALMGVMMLLAASASSMWIPALAFGVWAALSGIACAQAQGLLMDAFPDQRERWMTRWTLCGTIGDFATPLVIVAVAWLGLGWRGALAVAGVLHLGHALVLARVPIREGPSDDDDDDDEHESLWARMRRGLRDRELLAWLSASSLCCLLDEIFVVFAALFLHDQLGADLIVQAIAFGVCALGGVLGLVATDRLLHRLNPLRLLVVASLASVIAIAIWLQIRSIPISIGMLFVIGVVVAPLYPICAARAYAAKPGEPGLVAAVEQLFGWLPIVAPLLLGLIADHWGVVAALALLTIQPIGVGLVAALRMRPRQSVQDNAG
jgi:MFS family permease